jgi:hypothetical protein
VAVRLCGTNAGWGAVFAVAALVGVVSLATTQVASAQGFFDFLFGGPQRPPPQSPEPPPPSPEIKHIAPAPLGGQERVNEGGGSTGHTVAFCVRLCDGQHFPLEQMANSTPADTCHAICPHSQTKVYFGSEITEATARDGTRYSALNTALLYRKQLVPNCTCNGKDAFGLVPLDVRSDPTLRPGDIVSTKEGLEAYNGKSGQAEFTHVTPAQLGGQLNSIASPGRAIQGAQPAPQEIEDEPGTIVHPQAAPPR